MPQEKQYQGYKEPKLKVQEALPQLPIITKGEEVVAKKKEKFSNLVDDLGFISVTDTAPTYVPTHPLKKLVLYVNGATKRLYIYDTTNKVWYYNSLT